MIVLLTIYKPAKIVPHIIKLKALDPSPLKDSNSPPKTGANATQNSVVFVPDFINPPINITYLHKKK